MTIFVFTGPTLPAAEAQALLDAVYLGPAAQGDIYRAALARPFAIGLVDGYFERLPAVWHKEILWAMSEGVHVLGGASMGALRAVELEAYGMEGVGAIFAAFRSGELEDDDEVAVAHGDAESGYRPTSEAMVNIRATLRAAAAAGVVGEATRGALERLAKALYYPDRSYPQLLDRARAAGLPPEELAALSAFLPAGRVDQKRTDALALVRRLGELRATQPGPKQVAFSFEHTDAWDQVWRAASRKPALPGTGTGTGAGASATAASVPPERLAEELRLDAALCPRARRGAMLRALAVVETRRHGVAVKDMLHAETAVAFRRERGLGDGEALGGWQRSSDLDPRGYERFLEGEARLRWLEAVYEVDVLRHLADELRASGDYPAVRARAEAKHALLAAHGLEEPTLADAGMSPDELLIWYFGERLGRPRPLDLGRYLREVGLGDEDALRREALRELLYLHLSARTPG